MLRHPPLLSFLAPAHVHNSARSSLFGPECASDPQERSFFAEL